MVICQVGYLLLLDQVYGQKKDNDIGKQRLYDDLKAGVPLEERNRRRMEGYYDRKVR